MAASSSMAGFLVLLLALVVLAAGAREGPASSPAPAPQGTDGLSTAAAPTQVPASSPTLMEADAVGMVTLERPMSTASRRCDSDARWNDQLCRTVCGMFKFHGYEFTAAAADAVADQEDAAPRCCCCPGGATCNQL